jgi:hypothetical protein
MWVGINLRFVFSFGNLCLLYRSFIDLLQFSETFFIVLRYLRHSALPSSVLCYLLQCPALPSSVLCITFFSVLRYLCQSCVTFFSPTLPSVSCVTFVNPASSILCYLLQSCVTFFRRALPWSVLCLYLCPMFYFRLSFITFISLVFTFCYSFCVLTYF